MAGFQILILLIIITVVILNIILFFKVWGMTNNIKLLTSIYRHDKGIEEEEIKDVFFYLLSELRVVPHPPPIQSFVLLTFTPPYYPSKCSESRAESIYATRISYNAYNPGGEYKALYRGGCGYRSLYSYYS